jgi:[methyl-Co(III) methanol-specific corrinoid protein]:coenzyme M methyltransferase
MDAELNSKERVLKLFNREKIDRIPAFSGMGNITIHGMEKYGWKFTDIHLDSKKMAATAASTYQLFGFECAVVPFDLGVEAEALGVSINFYPSHEDVLYPTISTKVSEKAAELDIKIPGDLSKAGRIPVVTEAICQLKEEIGNHVAIGAHVLGPYTLAGQLTDIGDLAKAAFKKTNIIQEKLNTLAEVLIDICRIYKEAGADYLTVREMGAGPDILSPRMFKILIKPHLEKIFNAIKSPKVLHICGDINMIVDQMNECGADAISVDHKSKLADSRKTLGTDPLIFGDIDGFNILALGTAEDVDKAVKEAINNGVNAVWPGCDIWPTAPKRNMEALMAAVQKYGKLAQ